MSDSRKQKRKKKKSPRHESNPGTQVRVHLQFTNYNLRVYGLQPTSLQLTPRVTEIKLPNSLYNPEIKTAMRRMILVGLVVRINPGLPSTHRSRRPRASLPQQESRNAQLPHVLLLWAFRDDNLLAIMALHTSAPKNHQSLLLSPLVSRTHATPTASHPSKPPRRAPPPTHPSSHS